MHIKQITISNFRSFRQQPEIQPFSAGTNAVVGRNGSGKSNLFDAVQFVLLSPKFYTLRTEERQALLHEGTGSAAVSAFVEIVFDNSDNRFNTESASDEVVLRRTVGHKKDEFFLQRKRTQKNEIMSLLEGAGFSKSNPYFIVQQGKVNALCTMSDAERLALLKEVAGTTVYDEKKSESLAKMEANRQDIDKIEEILSYINDKLEELQGEKEELTQYQTLDRDRRAVEYTLYDKELRKARETLDDLEHQRAEEADQLTNLHEEARITHEEIRSCETKMKQRTNALRRNRSLLTSLEEKKKEKLTLRTQLDLEVKECLESLKQGQESAKSDKAELKRVSKQIAEAKETLESTVNPAYESAKETVTRIANEKEEATKKIDDLYAKQNRGRVFSTKRERDAFLRNQIGELEGSLEEKKEALREHEGLYNSLEKKREVDENNLKKKTEDTERKKVLLQELTTSLENSKRQRNTLAETRRDAWRTLDEHAERTSDARDEWRRCQSDSRKVTPRATGLGLAALKNIVREEGIGEDRYFGTVMENLRLKNESYALAVEVAAQNALHHVIVDSDATAAFLMEKLERGKLGRVTFLPLNQLRVDNTRYPESPDVTGLLDQCVEYDTRLERAFRHVFGRKLLARTAEMASHWSVQSGMDAITLEGDLCSRKGALTGGYMDVNRSKLKLFKEMTAAEVALRRLESEEQDMQRKNQSLDSNIANIMGEMQRLEAKKANLSHVIQKTRDEVETLENRISNRTRQMADIKEIIPSLEGECNSLPQQIDRLKAEMKTKLSDELTADERRTLIELKRRVKTLEEEIESQRLILEERSVERQHLTSLLEDNLLIKKRELEGFSSGGSTSSGDISSKERDLESRRRELEEAEREADDVAMKLSECKRIDADHKSILNEMKSELDKLKTRDAENKKSLEEASDSTDRLLNKRSMCVSKRELYTRKIQELGSLPAASTLAEHSSLSISGLMRKLDSINKNLKKYSHVNKKAFDQYVNFSEQRESLLNRKQELDAGAESVKELVEKLDRQKDEAINRTFRGVSAHFKDVFKELVPNGAGELIMKTAIVESDDDEDEDEEDTADPKKGKKERLEDREYDPNNPLVSLYRGIGIKVRFSPIGENYLMSQLSGGQKALVALALIFAIQRCDPAPFYLFDELDQALDSTYRAAVASVIERQANNEETPTQFICSTFRPELVAVANQCYGISHQNKVSNIHALSKKDALHFIQNLMNEEEAVGSLTAVSGRGRKGKRKGRSDSGKDEEEEEVVE